MTNKTSPLAAVLIGISLIAVPRLMADTAPGESKPTSASDMTSPNPSPNTSNPAAPAPNTPAPTAPTQGFPNPSAPASASPSPTESQGASNAASPEVLNGIRDAIMHPATEGQTVVAPENLDISMKDGKVVITGKVHNQQEKTDVGQRAAEAAGNLPVDNQLTIEP